MADLRGLHILNTRPVGQAGALTKLIEARGGFSIEFPVLEITAPSSWNSAEKIISELSAGDWIVFTSANAVRAVADRIDAVKKAATSVAVVGKQTGNVAREFGFQVRCTPTVATSEDLARELSVRLQGQKSGESAHVYFFRGRNIASNVLKNTITTAGIAFSEAIVYDVRTAEAAYDNAADLARKLIGGKVDLLIFTSSEAIRGLLSILNAQTNVARKLWHTVVWGLPVVVIGKKTADTARSERFNVVGIAERADDESLVEAIIKFRGR